MALSIKNDEAERLARELAAATGESVTRAVSVAVRERLERVNGYQGSARAVRAARLWQIADDSAGRWVAPFGTADHGDLLYDEAGLPR